jgi:hypothetical protein
MRSELQLPYFNVCGPAAAPRLTCERNLGRAIFLAAIEDYRSPEPERHESAALFLYPQSHEWQIRYDWAVALAEGLNPAWLRDALDRSKGQWDVQRSTRMQSPRPSRPTRHARRCDQ